MKQEIISMARDAGFEQIGIVSAAPFLAWKKASDGQDVSGIEYDPSQLLPGVTAILVLLRSCAPYTPFPQGTVPLPSYYISSNAGYFAAKELAEKLFPYGRALYTNRIPQRQAALRMGGILGKNQLLYRPGLGSFFTVQTILTDFLQPEPDGEVRACDGCGSCQASCPTGALKNGFCREKCLRQMLEDRPPKQETARYVQQILGCEACQRACPLNRGIPMQEPPEEILSMFTEEHLLSRQKADRESLAALVGKNYQKRLAEQAELYLSAHRHPETESL